MVAVMPAGYRYVVRKSSKTDQNHAQDSNHAWAEEEEAQWVVVPKGEESW